MPPANRSGSDGAKGSRREKFFLAPVALVMAEARWMAGGGEPSPSIRGSSFGGRRRREEVIGPAQFDRPPRPRRQTRPLTCTTSDPRTVTSTQPGVRQSAPGTSTPSRVATTSVSPCAAR
jgi:hypothetical protein